MAAYERVTLNRGGRNSRFDCTSKIQPIYQVIFDSSNHQCGIRVSYDMISFNCSGDFSPMLRHCYCKARRMS